MSNQPSPNKKSEEFLKPTFAAGGCLVIIGLLVISSMIAGSTDSNKNNKQKQKNLSSWKKKDNSTSTYYVVTESVIKPYLKCPSTADFPYAHNKDVYILRYEDTKYSVNGYVDSQNSFGAMIRTRYTARVEETFEGKWELILLKMGGEIYVDNREKEAPPKKKLKVKKNGELTTQEEGHELVKEKAIRKCKIEGYKNFRIIKHEKLPVSKLSELRLRYKLGNRQYEKIILYRLQRYYETSDKFYYDGLICREKETRVWKK